MKKTLIIINFFIIIFSHAQLPIDCVNALTVCGSDDINLDVNGFGIQEVSFCGSQENNSLWLKIRVETSGTLGFTLTPASTSIYEDYDFSVYGPNVTCNNLGSSIRCSTTNPFEAGLTSNTTGMNNSSTDFFEGPGSNGDSFVKWLDVIAGEQYYILIDRPIGNSSFNLTWTGTASIGQAPEAYTIPDLEQCNDNTTPVPFDLTQNENILLGSQTGLIVSYHTSISDATIGINPIPTPSSYTNIANDQIIYVRVENPTSGCAALTQFHIRVNQLNFSYPTSVDICDDTPFDGFSNFDLTTVEQQILNGTSNLLVSFYDTSLADAQTGGTSGLITNLSNFTNTTNPQTIWVRVEKNGNQNCYATRSIQLVVNETPIAYPMPDIEQCTDNANALPFDLTQNESILLGSQTGLETNYYLSTTDAINNSNAIVDPTAFTATSNDQIIYVRLENPNSGCFDISQFHVQIHSLVFNDPNDINLCDDPYDGFGNFDLSIAEQTILNASTSLVVQFYDSSLADAQAGGTTGRINNSTNYANSQNPQTIWVRIFDTQEPDCYAIRTLVLHVNPLPIINTPQSVLKSCDNGNAKGLFDLTQIQDEIISGQSGLTVTYYDLNGNAISNPVEFLGESQQINVEVTNSFDCSSFVNFNIEVLPEITVGIIDDLLEYSIDDYAQFDFSNLVSNIINGRSDIAVSFHSSLDDAETGVNALSMTYTNVSNPQDIYVRIYYVDYACPTIGTFQVRVKPIFPQFFTPNGDGFNDTWQPIQDVMPPNSIIYIYDRFGKLIYKMNPTQSWDGTINGVPLPANDYWFFAVQPDQKMAKGHFSLIR